MIYRVSVLRGTKLNPEKVQVTEVMADRFVVTQQEKDVSLWEGRGEGVLFFVDTTNWRGKTTSALVAFLPGTEWIVESA